VTARCPGLAGKIIGPEDFQASASALEDKIQTQRKMLGANVFYIILPRMRCFLNLLSVFVTFGCMAAAPDKPAIRNVLFLISDDLKASTLGCYGDKTVKTPHIDALARNGLVFDRAYCQGTSCAPSRQSLMFSKYKGRGDVNMGQHFRENGFYSARVGKIYHMRVPGDIIGSTDGLDEPSSWTEAFNSPGREAHTPGDYACLNLNIFTRALDGRQSTKMPHRMFVTVSYDGDGSDQPDWKTATKTIDLLGKHRDKPFFLAAGFVRPHYPMVTPKRYFDMYPWENLKVPELPAGDLDDIPLMGLAGNRNDKNPIGKHPDNWKRMWAGYYASITFMDEQVGRVLKELDRLGLRDSTAVVFTSDHGYHLGEHTFWEKSNLHEDVLRVPLIISIPGMKPGRTMSLAELMDLYPTLSQLAGLEIPKETQGRSLVSVLKNHRQTVRRGAMTVGRRGYALRTSDWAYARYHDASEELYDMRSDPRQFTNLALSSERADQLEELRKQLSTKVQGAGLEFKATSGKKKSRK
jgi:iduronate 2-sulfatase